MDRALVILVLMVGFRVSAQPSASVVESALVAEARFDTAEALRLYLAALEQEPQSPFLLQKIARQYSDTVDEADALPERRRLAELALSYARRAVALQPDNAVNVLSVAIAQGKMALASDPAQRLELSREVRAGAEQALRLDPTYAWAHHVLGRWHFEVVQVKGARRLFARLLYGGLPSASLDEALYHLQRAVELAPDHLLHRVEYGFALEAAGRVDEAREQWQKSLTLPLQQKDDANAQARAQAALAGRKVAASTPRPLVGRPGFGAPFFYSPGASPASSSTACASAGQSGWRVTNS